MNCKILCLFVLTSITVLAQSDFAFGQITEESNFQENIQLLSETPPCFMIASDGRMIDLSSLCDNPSSNLVLPDFVSLS
jgi:hypothetical protein